MSCCSPIAAALAMPTGLSGEEIRLASRLLGDGVRLTELSVPDIRCGSCIHTIESALRKIGDVVGARVNLTARRVSIRWRERGSTVPPFVECLAQIGYPGHLYDPGETDKDPALAALLRALAVAGFASSNIMLLSVSVWSGADAAARDLFHWISAGLALPAIAYSGGVFFRSAWGALRQGGTNMDVPISIGVVLAFVMSVYDTLHSGQHAYFDAAVSLLFFLLIGRTLDHAMREKARSAVKGLARLGARGALVERPDGTRDYLPASEIIAGMTVIVPAGERLPMDGEVLAGQSDVDCSLVTGESLPKPAIPGTKLQGGTLNLTGPLRLTATAAAKDSFLAEMVRLMEAAEAGRSRYRRIADRAASLYAPAVHLIATLSFVGWMLVSGDLHYALTIAIAVLIITCPCALALAVPMVQVTAARRLFEAGILMKDGGGLERLAAIDTVVFDKTGTLTLGQPTLVNAAEIRTTTGGLAAAIAVHSRHPQSRAIAAAFDACDILFDVLAEHPGLGLEAHVGGNVYRLGRADWALESGHGRLGTVLSHNGECLAEFAFADGLRPDARDAIAALRERGLSVKILSGDRPEAVEGLAATLGIDDFVAGALPAEKVEAIAALAATRKRVLMIGDGLNDAPALAAAHASMAPANAADVGRSAADFVFLHASLSAVPLALDLARNADRLTRQNIVLAVIYNALALPFAVAGLVTPLFAALAMSSSSVLVIANALRLGKKRKTPRVQLPKRGDALPLNPLAQGVP